MIVRRNFLINCLFFVLTVYCNGQVLPEITARVDTSIMAKRQIYELFCNYINSNPDSIYVNPCWNKKEAQYFTELGLNCNRAGRSLYSKYDSLRDFYQYYLPKIMSIVRLDTNRYEIKILYNYCTEKYKKWNPDCITKLYAVKNKNGIFKLENLINYNTRNWRRYNYSFIHYVVSPGCSFDKKAAEEAVQFCKTFVERFHLQDIEPFTYYVTSNSNEMSLLFNFDYELSYSTGRTFYKTRTLYTSWGNFNYPHEFVHLLLYEFILSKKGYTFIINEGIATWLGGPNFNQTYEESLIEFSNDIKNIDSLSIDDITHNRYRNPHNNNPIYVTGAVICDMVYEKVGIKGVKRLINLNMEDLKNALIEIFDKSSWEEVDRMVMDYIRSYSTEKNENPLKTE